MRDAMNMTLHDLQNYNAKGESPMTETVCPLDDLAESVAIMKACKTRITELQKLFEEHRALVQEKMGSKETTNIDGKPVLTWKTYRKNLLNQAYLRLNYAGIYELCKETTETRRMEIL